MQKDIKTVTIHGNQYVPVSERVKEIHQELKGTDFSIITELLPVEGAVVFKATVRIGEQEFTGHSGANPSKAIEKQSPYEVAETSAIGRALGFAGYGLLDSISTADEIEKAEELGF